MQSMCMKMILAMLFIIETVKSNDMVESKIGYSYGSSTTDPLKIEFTVPSDTT